MWMRASLDCNGETRGGGAGASRCVACMVSSTNVLTSRGSEKLPRREERFKGIWLRGGDRYTSGPLYCGEAGLVGGQLATSFFALGTAVPSRRRSTVGCRGDAAPPAAGEGVVACSIGRVASCRALIGRDEWTPPPEPRWPRALAGRARSCAPCACALASAALHGVARNAAAISRGDGGADEGAKRTLATATLCAACADSSGDHAPPE
jgi:hypothetical protein